MSADILTVISRKYNIPESEIDALVSGVVAKHEVETLAKDLDRKVQFTPMNPAGLDKLKVAELQAFS